MRATGLKWSAAILALMVLMGVWVVAQIPPGEQVPIHFDASGSADGFGGRGDVAFIFGLIIAISAFVTGLMVLVSNTVEVQAGDGPGGRVFLVCWIGTLVLMLLTLGVVAVAMLGQAELGLRALMLLFPAFGIFLGNYLPKTEPNGFVGIRTPKTMSDPEVWSRTHRMAGKWMVVGGALGLLIAALAPLPIAIAASIASLTVPLLCGLLFSIRL